MHYLFFQALDDISFEAADNPVDTEKLNDVLGENCSLHKED